MTYALANSRILAALGRHHSLTREEIAEAAHVSANTLSGGGYLQRLKEAGLIFISGWRRNACGAFVIPQYSLGAGPDAVRPAITEDNRSAHGMDALLGAFTEFGPLNYRQAALLAGLSPLTVKNSGYIQALIRQGKLHIHAWQRPPGGGSPRAFYMAGPGQNAEKPAPLTNQERLRGYRQRQSNAAGGPSLAAQFRILATSDDESGS